VFKVLREDEVLKDWTHSSQETHCNVFICSTTASNRHCHQGCSLGLERLGRDGLEAFFRTSRSRLDTVTPKSRSHLGLDAPTSRSVLGLETLASQSRLSLGFLRLVYIELQSSNWGL